MASVSAPLLSLSASGKFANTLVASTWKGIPVMRQYKVPANPNTLAQSTHRAKMTGLVASWKAYFTNAAVRTAYNVLASLQSSPMSGFNVFVKEGIGIYAAHKSFVQELIDPAAAAIVLSMGNINDGSVGDEAGNFEIWIGTSKSNMALHSDEAIAAGALTFDVHGTYPTATDVYFKIMKGNVARSGIFAVTLT